jgi:hypothetical protein
MKRLSCRPTARPPGGLQVTLTSFGLLRLFWWRRNACVIIHTYSVELLDATVAPEHSARNTEHLVAHGPCRVQQPHKLPLIDCGNGQHQGGPWKTTGCPLTKDNTLVASRLPLRVHGQETAEGVVSTGNPRTIDYIHCSSLSVPDHEKPGSWCRLSKAHNWPEMLGIWNGEGMERGWKGGGQFTSNLGPRRTGLHHAKGGFPSK